MTLENGYELQTTFWEDFSIADRFGLEAVQDTYNRAFKEWKKDINFMTELSIVLNLKLWQHYEAQNEEFSILYDKLWRKCDNYILDHFNKNEIRQYLTIID